MEHAWSAVGCLYIDELTPGTRNPSGRLLFNAVAGASARFAPPGDGRLWEALQIALQQARRGKAVSGVVALGSGCCGALALAEQLPVDRLVLIAPSLFPGRESGPALRRIAAFARRNLCLCASEVLAVKGEERPERALRPGRLAAQGRLIRMEMRADGDGKLYTNREFDAKNAVSHFLRTGELPKSLAENPEMCIIYG